MNNQPISPTYTLNTFYAELGGYVIEINKDGTHGLVVAMQDQGISSWYNGNHLVKNPDNHDANGAKFNDWRLPTKVELQLMYNNKLNIGGFHLSDSDFIYWSSTEYRPIDARFNFAYVVFFNIGAESNYDKGYKQSVRAVRDF